jgi:hypothetical protein
MQALTGLTSLLRNLSLTPEQPQPKAQATSPKDKDTDDWHEVPQLKKSDLYRLPNRAVMRIAHFLFKNTKVEDISPEHHALFNRLINRAIHAILQREGKGTWDLRKVRSFPLRTEIEAIAYLVTSIAIDTYKSDERLEDCSWDDLVAFFNELAFRFPNCTTIRCPDHRHFSLHVLSKFTHLQTVDFFLRGGRAGPFNSVTTVRLQGIQGANKSIKCLFNFFPHMQALHLNPSEKVSEEMFADFIQCKDKFTALDLGSLQDIPDKDLLKCLEAQPRLTELSLRDANMSQETLTYLCEHLGELQTLTLTLKNPKSLSGLQQLSKLSKLQSLELDIPSTSVKANGECFREIAKIKTLTRLVIGEKMHFGSISLTALQDLPLHTLRIGQFVYVDSNCKEFFEKTAVRKFEILNCTWHTEDFVKLCSHMKKLQQLTLRLIKPVALDPLASVQTLFSLRLLIQPNDRQGVEQATRSLQKVRQISI